MNTAREFPIVLGDLAKLVANCPDDGRTVQVTRIRRDDDGTPSYQASFWRRGVQGEEAGNFDRNQLLYIPSKARYGVLFPGGKTLVITRSFKHLTHVVSHEYDLRHVSNASRERLRALFNGDEIQSSAKFEDDMLTPVIYWTWVGPIPF